MVNAAADEGKKGKNIVSQMLHGDCRLQMEYMVPKGSNSGIYFLGRYEVQTLDSYTKPDDKVQHGDNGGHYE